MKIYNSGVLQGKQGAHQSFLFLNKQGENPQQQKEKEKASSCSPGDGRQENAPPGKVFHCQRSLSPRDLERQPLCPLRGDHSHLNFTIWAIICISQHKLDDGHTRCYLTTSPSIATTLPTPLQLQKLSGSGAFW